MTAALYDTIGRGYAHLRRPDPRIAAPILRALEGTTSVLNVGAGAGSYEPSDRRLSALERSLTMIRQRPGSAAPAVCGSAETLPFGDGAFDATLAILTLHHWPDQPGGLHEMARVARRRAVLLTWDPAFFESSNRSFWLLDYFPESLELDRKIFPTLDAHQEQLGPCEVWPVSIPHDCSDGFLGAYWRRPAAYLDPLVRSAISTFSKLTDLSALDRLRQDLDSGAWQERYGHLLTMDALDLGYRLIVARLAP